ncbi:hypothetical protein KC19_3G165700 [Ceratodon purpureus]|uniref:Hemimethylated DNA-binding domain-containing protein n=1 Tax=Ceratodon purpureus TaxID=3225 RepID=A0A8T0IKR6_CERPU|nr:hypothetical protein KC19_3G165700 [Ceratodon purpureus]
MCASYVALGLAGGGSATMAMRPAIGGTSMCSSFRTGRRGREGGGWGRVEVGEVGSSRDGRVCCSGGVGMRMRGVVVCRAKKREVAGERSDRANEELLMFFFQLDLTTRLQRALNQDMYEAAQGLREKIAEVEREMERQRKVKMGAGSSKDEAHDTAITLLQTKAELQRLIEAEDYAAAGAVRNKINALEAESLAAQANAMIFQQRSYEFRLGQKVKHKVLGYRGVICGMDPLCCETEDWISEVGVQELPRGRNQPFYQVLVDIREEPSVMVTYVAEDNLVAPEEPDFEQFDHPYVYFLFYGMDGAGDFIACKQLREKYDAPRHELPYDEDKEGES